MNKRRAPHASHFHPAVFLAGAVLWAAALMIWCGACRAADFTDYPLSGELEEILVEYEAMPLEDRVEAMPARIADYVAANPGDPLGYYVCGLTAMDRQEFGAALTWFGTALGLAPDLADAHAQSAMALLYSRQVDPAAGATATLSLAFEAVNRAVDLSPGRPDLRVMQATVALEAGDPWTAARAMETGVILAPGSVMFHIRLGAIFLKTQMPKRALEQFNIAYILNSQANPYALEDRAQVIDATTALATSAQRAAAEPAAGMQAVEQLQKKKEFLEAAAKAGELAQQYPFDPDVITLAAVTRVQAFNDVDTAVAYLQRVIDSAPLHGRAREALCGVRQVQAKIQDEQEAQDGEHEAQDGEQAPDSGIQEFLLEPCLRQAADVQNTAALLDALFSDPERVDWLRQIGNQLVSLQRPDRALPFLQAAVYLAPDDPDCAQDLDAARTLALDAAVPQSPDS